MTEILNPTFLLKNTLLTEHNFPLLVREFSQLMDNEIMDKSGFDGWFIRTSYNSINLIIPNFIMKVIEDLLTSWVEKIEPMYLDWLSAKHTNNLSFGSYCNKHSENLADLTLNLVDIAVAVKYQSIILIYNKMRPIAKTHMVLATPKVGKILDKYLS